MALRWTSAALQAKKREQDIVTIDGESKSVSEILDDADAALAALQPAEQPEDERSRFEASFKAADPVQTKITDLTKIRGNGDYQKPSAQFAWLGWQAAKRDVLTQAPQEPLKWKFTGIAGLKKYLTDSQYQAQTDDVKKWYEPICETCQQSAPQERVAVAVEIVALSSEFAIHPQLKSVIGREALILRCVDRMRASLAQSSEGEKQCGS
jgi:hypothetical protein